MVNKKQSGLTAISWMVVLAYLALQGLLAMRIIPVYMDYNTVQTVVSQLAEDKIIKGKSAKEIRNLLRKRFKINSLYELAKSKDAYTFSKIQGGYHVVIKYEERGPIIKNLNFIIDFEYAADFKTR